MKKSEITTGVLAGRKLMLGEYRGFEVRDGTSQKTGKPYVMAACAILVGNQSVSVGYRTEANATTARDVKPPAFRPGQTVCLEFTHYAASEFQPGVIEAKGKLCAVED